MLGDTQPLLATTLDADDFSAVSERLSWWIAGLAVLADWIGSNTDYFKYRDEPPLDGRLDDYWEHAKTCAAGALAATGVLPAPSPSHATLMALFPNLPTASPLQAWANGQALPVEPCLVMLEDVTGAGKTEAAVLLAHRLMSSGAADGFFIGLPTMATANAMYGRIADVFGRLFGEDASLALAHGQRDLVEAFAGTVLRAGPTEGDPTQRDESASARCTAWLADHNKRALIAAAGVGTIDQAMLGVLHSKHQSLRLLGLFRKVLIVDEVHACDPYMQRVLESLLEFHAYSGGCAILLSATLPQGMKQALLTGYARGRKLALGGRAASPPRLESNEFPLAITWHAGLRPARYRDSYPRALRPSEHNRCASRAVGHRDPGRRTEPRRRLGRRRQRPRTHRPPDPARRPPAAPRARRPRRPARAARRARPTRRALFLGSWPGVERSTGLGEASTTVVLARWAGERLLPWVEHASLTAAWAYSSVRVPQRLIAKRAPGSTPAREAALCATEADMPGAGKWSVLLPLEQGATGAWQGSAMTAEQKHRPSRPCEWTYAATTGLMPMQQPEEDDD